MLKRGTQKVEKALKQGGIHVVWMAWFTDSIAQWKRQDERHYLLEDNSVTNVSAPVSSSPPSDPNGITTDTDPEGTVDDEEVEPPEDQSKRATAVPASLAEVNTGKLDLGEVDWENMHDEVEAAMMESDSEDERSNGTGMSSGNVSEDDGYQTSEMGGGTG